MSDYPRINVRAEGGGVCQLSPEETAEIMRQLGDRQASVDLHHVISGMLDEIDTKLADVTATLDRIGTA